MASGPPEPLGGELKGIPHSRASSSVSPLGVFKMLLHPTKGVPNQAPPPHLGYRWTCTCRTSAWLSPVHPSLTSDYTSMHQLGKWAGLPLALCRAACGWPLRTQKSRQLGRGVWQTLPPSSLGATGPRSAASQIDLLACKLMLLTFLSSMNWEQMRMKNEGQSKESIWRWR